MAEGSTSNPAVDEFVERELDSVPHLEALLLLYTNRSVQWSVEDMAAALFVDLSASRDVLQDLVRRRLATRTDANLYAYNSSPEHDGLVAALQTEYRRNLIHLTRMIHAKASRGVREFADAFRFKKDPD
jgi:hypothetical protein